MPLAKGSSDAVRSENIGEMVHAGHPVAQAVAAAYNQQREAQHAHHDPGQKEAHHGRVERTRAG